MLLLWMTLGYLLGGCKSHAPKAFGERVAFLKQEKLTYDLAQDGCEKGWEANSTSLLRVDTKEIHKWIKEQKEVVWINGKVENELSWNDGSAMDGFAAHNLPEEAGQFCLSANDIPGRLTVKQCLVEQAYACQWKYGDFDVTTAPGRALKYFGEQLNHDDAAEYCATKLPRTGYLITVNNAEVNNWVVEKSDRMWIGLNDENSEGTHVWESGKTSEYTNWHTGKTGIAGPDDGGDEDCVEANLPEGELKWNDIPCTYTRSFACEIWL